MKKILTFSLFLIVCFIPSTFAQISVFKGAWQLMMGSVPLDKQDYVPVILRTFDDEGNYVQIAVSQKNSFVESRARFKVLDSATVEEKISYAVNPGRLGKVFKFHYKFETQRQTNYMIVEGGKKTINGVDTFTWREVWRKVEEYKAN